MTVVTAPRAARAELAVALAKLNDEFGKLPPTAQDHAAANWGSIDAALTDEGTMVADAIRRWEQRHLALFDEARAQHGGGAVIAWRPWPWPDCPARMPAGGALR